MGRILERFATSFKARREVWDVPALDAPLYGTTGQDGTVQRLPLDPAPGTRSSAAGRSLARARADNWFDARDS